MRAIVFGGSGFIGSHVADELTNRNYEVVIFDLVASPYLRPSQEMIIGDIMDRKAVNQAVKDCDYVYNFAGIADLDDATTRPAMTIELNIMGTVNIIEACLASDCKRFIYGSTIYVYSQKGGFYRCSKQSAELYIEEYANSSGLQYTVLRYGSVYGPRADRSNAIYNYMLNAIQNQRVLCTNPEEMREYIHVRDAAVLSVDILKEEYVNSHIILTGHYRIKVREMMDIIKEMFNNQISIEYTEGERSNWHYSYTPYSFTPKIGDKLVRNRYVDLGQGLLECLVEIRDKLNQEK